LLSGFEAEAGEAGENKEKSLWEKPAPSNLSHTTRDRTARIIWGDVDGASSLGVNAIYSIKNVTIYQVLDFPLDTCISNS
jgi:hypothetical protein